MKRMLLILLFALGGIALSGYLSWYAYLGPGCRQALITCGTDKPVLIFGQPTCIYGLAMFLIVFILGLVALGVKQRPPIVSTILGFAGFGLLFSGGLTVYEVFFVGVHAIPACVYGFVLYAGIFVAAWREHQAERIGHGTNPL